MKGKQFALIGMMMLLSACSRSNQPELQDFLSDDDCSAPCWNGIQPAQTHVDDAKAILTDLEISFREQMFPSGYGVIFADIPPSLIVPEENGLLGLTTNEYIVVALSIDSDICVSTVIENYGEPDLVYGSADSPGEHLNLVYSIDELYLEFSVSSVNQMRIWYIAILTQEHYPIIAASTWEEVKDNHLSETCVDEFSH